MDWSRTMRIDEVNVRPFSPDGTYSAMEKPAFARLGDGGAGFIVLTMTVPGMKPDGRGNEDT